MPEPGETAWKISPLLPSCQFVAGMPSRRVRLRIGDAATAEDVGVEVSTPALADPEAV